jgi:hypothetical protein
MRQRNCDNASFAPALIATTGSAGCRAQSRDKGDTASENSGCGHQYREGHQSSFCEASTSGHEPGGRKTANQEKGVS